jgi:hypothetical protein
MLDSSDTFLVNESPALAYMFANNDYDVWLAISVATNIQGVMQSIIQMKIKSIGIS